ncbi:MAG: hypothetical protein HYV26_04810, partial [Candidatus Hydrogenedentes bacterium]|nr:hypothetical protein [Candidatus Hydrogenedentota bacterium]
MATRLGEYLVYGELRNVTHYSTFGVLLLRGGEPGAETMIRFELTGDCDPDLRGKCVRFWPEESETAGPVFDLDKFRDFEELQVGPTGTMTAEGWARALPCSVEEYLDRSRLGEPPPTAWKRRLYLEWFGQNGRVVTELAGVVVQEQIREPENDDDEGAWAPLPHRAPKPRPDEKLQGSLDITEIHLDDGEVQMQSWTTTPSDEEEEDEDSEYGDLPDELQRDLDAEARAIDRALREEHEFEEDDTTPGLGLVDTYLESGDAAPVIALLGDIEPPPPVDALDEEQAEAYLKV